MIFLDKILVVLHFLLEMSGLEERIAVSDIDGKRTAAVRTAGNQILWYGDVVSHGGHHFLHRLHGVPGIVRAADGALEKPVVALDFSHFVFRVKFDKLRVLVGGKDEKIFPL